MAFLDSFLNQIAVYWPTPVKDGYGKLSFGTPIEINCRWQQKNELFLNSEGKETLSRAVIYPDQDVEVEGYMYLGRLTDLSILEKANPQLEVNAFPIKAYLKTIDVNGKEYVRKIWL